jgi:hypothetical protein
MRLRRIGRDAGLGTRATRSKALLVVVTVVPVLLIGYALAASLLAPDTDVPLVLGALLITGVASFVIWDTLRSGSRPAEALRPVRVSHRPRRTHR